MKSSSNKFSNLSVVKNTKANQAFHMDSEKASYHAGEAKGQAQEKASNLMDKASNAAQSAKESCQEAGAQLQAKAHGAAEAVKEATGMNKNN
ncbi:Late embryogenesis abundant protein 14-like protein [Drosera capensis]